jgi:release factor glutamine methyltransferase
MDLKDLNWLIKEKYTNNINLNNFTKDFKKLQKNIPLDYVIGETDFLNCIINLKYKPLIPRVETIWYMEKETNFLKNYFNKKIEILDIFSGSGCMGIYANKILNSNVTFSDIKNIFLKQIKLNCMINNINNYTIIKSNIFKKINKQYDLILANPPYIPKKDLIQKSVFKYEPSIALFGKGKGGLSIISIFLKNLNSHLKNNGLCILEFHPNQKEKIQDILDKSNFKYIFKKDQYLRDRYVLIFKK